MLYVNNQSHNEYWKINAQRKIPEDALSNGLKSFQTDISFDVYTVQYTLVQILKKRPKFIFFG